MSRIFLLTLCIVTLQFFGFGQSDTSGILQLGRVILPIKQMDKDLVYADSLWMPSTSQVTKMLPAVSQYLKICSRNLPTDNAERNIYKDILDSLTQFKIQCVGKFRDGKKLIHFNFFNAKHHRVTYWQKKYVWVMDGGNDYWRIDVELSNQQCDNFMVNGVA